jgi:hypothetical protein
MSARKPRLGDVVEVEWLDSQHIDLGWSTVKDYIDAARQPQSYRTAGYFIEQRKHLVVGLSLDPGNRQMTNAMSIPSKVVSSIKVLGRSNASVRKALR